MSSTRIVMIVLAGLIAMCVIALLTLAASAQQQFCGPKHAMLHELEVRYDEFPAMHLDSGKDFIVTRSANGSWTLLKIEDGKACVIGAGSRSRYDRGT